MPDKIVCLVGESGSGKTTIAKLLEERGYNVIKSYTTRSPREPDEWGHEFVRLDTYWIHKDVHQISLEDSNEPYIVAETEFDGNRYWATVKQYKGKGTSIYVIDPAGVEYLRKKVTDAEIVIIYLRVTDIERLGRMLDREKDVNVSGSAGIVDKVCKRLDHDVEKFKLIRCDWVVDNNGEIEGAVEAIVGIIGGE